MAKSKTKFGIRSIKTNQFATIDDVFHDGNEVGIETGFHFGLDKKNRLIKVEFNLSFKCNKDPFIVLKLACEFEIDSNSFKKFTVKESEKITVPKDFITHLMMITVGTARGVLHAKLENTPYDRFFLPTIDISGMINEDVEFD